MVTIEEAFKIVQSIVPVLEVEEVDIRNVMGRVLAEPVRADRDLPPFNRVAMDGIAIHLNKHTVKGQLFFMEDVQAAGSPPLTLKNQSNCIEVMTGSVLPDGTDTVIRYEDLDIKGKNASILIEKIEVGKNVHRQGQDAKEGDVLLNKGQKISAAEIALLAAIGKKLVRVFDFPKTAVVSSGNELVEIEEIPLAHQIRKSNVYALQAAMINMGWKSESFHLPDALELVKKNLQAILESKDVLILSGGVSKGKFDFIPEALEQLGIQKLFHQVSQRPGKPFWFGTSADRSKIVFALPGNPVSTFLCFYKYIKPWIVNCFGDRTYAMTARLMADIDFAPPLTYFLQVRAEIKDGVLIAHPHGGGGSGDFANLRAVDGFLELPLEKSTFQKGEVYPFIPFR